MNSLLFAGLLTEPVGVSHYLIVGAVLFVCGALCMATKRNALGVLMGIELVLNGANLNFIAFGSPGRSWSWSSAPERTMPPCASTRGA